MSSLSSQLSCPQQGTSRRKDASWKEQYNLGCAEQQICSQSRLWEINRPWVKVIVFIHGSAAGSLVITALTCWLAWAAVLPCGHVGRTTDPLFPILSPATHLQQRGRWVLYAAPSWHPMLCVASSPPWTLVSLFAGPQCLFLNDCTWNKLPNPAAKSTPNNQIIVMFVDELFLYTVLVANKSLNPFRRLEKAK